MSFESRLLECLEEDFYLEGAIEDTGGTIVKNEWLVGHSRWAIHYAMVVKHEDKFYRIDWDGPATEYQEGLDRSVTVREVHRITKTVVDYILPPKAY